MSVDWSEEDRQGDDGKTKATVIGRRDRLSRLKKDVWPAEEIPSHTLRAEERKRKREDAMPSDTRARQSEKAISGRTRERIIGLGCVVQGSLFFP